MANKKNLANGQLNSGILAAATSLDVKAGQGANFPAAPFYVTVTPIGVLSTLENSEIMLVTSVTTDTFTVDRAQMGTGAKDFDTDSIVANGVYAEDIEEKLSKTNGSTTVELTDPSSDFGSGLKLSDLSGYSYLFAPNEFWIYANTGDDAWDMWNSALSLTPTTAGLSLYNDDGSGQAARVELRKYSADAANSGVALSGGETPYNVLLKTTNLTTTNRTLEFPDEAGTLATQEYVDTEIASSGTNITASDAPDGLYVNSSTGTSARIAFAAPGNLLTGGFMSNDQAARLNSAITTVTAGTGILVDESLAGQPVVSLDSHTHAIADTTNLQTELDAKVEGPASSTDNAIAAFDGITGKQLENSPLGYTQDAAHIHLTYPDDGIRVESLVAGSLSTDTINEETTGTGVTVDGVLIKDGLVDGVDISEAVLGSNSFIDDETPTGSVNGSNTSFTTAQAYVAGSLEVFVNGLKQARTTHYTETTPGSGVFTFLTAPLTGDVVRVSYQHTTAAAGNADTLDGYHASTTPSAGTIPVLDGSGDLHRSAIPETPAFAAYNPNGTGTAVPQTVFTKVEFQTELFDTHGWFANSRFTPQIAGKYQLNSFVGLMSVTDQQTIHVAIYKNGASLHWTRFKQSGSGELGGMVSAVVDANGTTDYFEIYVWHSSVPTNVAGSQQNTWFNGHLV